MTLAVLLSLVSALCYAAAAILQEGVAARPEPGALAAARSGSWWAAVALNGSGALLHVLALRWGPLTVVQSLGVLTIVFALPMAAVFTRRAVTRSAWGGAVLVCAGLALLLLMTSSGRAPALSCRAQIVLGAAALAAVGLLVWSALCTSRPLVRSVVLAAAAGVAFAVASVFVKSVADGWSLDSVGDRVPGMVMAVAFAAVGTAASQASYRGAGLAAPLATVTVSNPAVASVVGILVLGEGFRFGALGAVLAVAASVAAVYGLVMLSTDHVRSASRTQVVATASGVRTPTRLQSVPTEWSRVRSPLG